MSYFKTYDSINIFYKVINQNKSHTLFFLHGWSGNYTFFEILKDYLANFNIIFWDARSHGKSDIIRNAKIKDIANDFNFFLENIYDFNTPIIPIGHSMGALTLFEYINNYGTEKLYKMVIVDQSPKLITDNEWNMGIYGNFPESLNQEFIKLYRQDIGNGVIKLSVSGLNKQYREVYEKRPDFFYSQKRTFSKDQNDALTDLWEDFVQKDYRNMLSKINIPSLLIFGSGSPYYNHETRLYLKEKIKDSKLHIIKGGDHSPFNSNPKEFSDEITNFILN